ncbi:hypothetical protein TIFTF001_048991 [Ficus carica]|uniref:Uncharacterized protein n=1 Tax=Ficus carica TaxID=3494 RepID=A0AA88CMQ3_FICCA|nr:hypothetical protein TIFTF001_048991 [Ficus carica]
MAWARRGERERSRGWLGRRRGEREAVGDGGGRRGERERGRGRDRRRERGKFAWPRQGEREKKLRERMEIAKS